MFRKYKKKLTKSKLRCNIFRKKILELSQKVSALHLGGTFSCVEIMDCIFNILMKKDEKDYFIMSKGHGSILQYVILNFQGIVSNKSLSNYSKSDGHLGVHPEIKNKGINASTGSLGHGLAMSAGFALSNRKKLVYTVLSDGELQEGSTWEAAMVISNLKLNNIVMVVDNNDFQSLEKSSKSHPALYPIDEKFKAFGWDTKICDGHNVNKILVSILKRKKNKPFCLIAKTIKGYPISFMKNKPIWHYKSPSKLEHKKAMKELDKI